MSWFAPLPDDYRDEVQELGRNQYPYGDIDVVQSVFYHYEIFPQAAKLVGDLEVIHNPYLGIGPS